MDANGDGKLSKEEIKNGYQTHFGRTMNDGGQNRKYNSRSNIVIESHRHE